MINEPLIHKCFPKSVKSKRLQLKLKTDINVAPTVNERH